MDLSFYEGKKVLITGHTGFKGSWMCRMLLKAGAQVVGYSLNPPTNPSLFEIAGLSSLNAESGLVSYIGDIRDLDNLKKVFETEKPEIVIHMAAQPIVRDSYKNPVYTYETNVIGTVNVMEAVRLCASVKSFVNVTTDKVYLNVEKEEGYTEDEKLNGYDPYSNSKSCSELITSSYKNSFFGAGSGIMADGRKVAISTCRAGNVIGGGDFANDRIIPDCIRAVTKGEKIVVRNPYSIRPYQHVLEPVYAYLLIAAKQHPDYGNIELSGCYNIGPEDADCQTTGNLVTLFCEKWNQDLTQTDKCAAWEENYDGGPHEANFLKLNCEKAKKTFDWKPRWNVEKAMEEITLWTKAYIRGEDMTKCMDRQIDEFLGGED